MKRHIIQPRENWEQIAKDNGFHFHHINGDLYWDESAYYSFTLEEIEKQLEDPAQEIHNMCLELVDEAVSNEEILTKLRIPEKFWNYIAQSWKDKEPSMYGRFDFSYNGKDPAKLLEYNADTPTALYEASYFQWLWLTNCIENKTLSENTDQFNSIQEHLIDFFEEANKQLPFPDKTIHFACMKNTEEDRATVEYIMDCALQSKINPSFVYMEDIGVTEDNDFLDLENRLINVLFKLYPWEFIWNDNYADAILHDRMKLLEPAWKMVLSNKGILPLLWERHKGHPNLLPAGFYTKDCCTLKEYDKIAFPNKKPVLQPFVENFVKKPLLSREGAGISLFGVLRSGESFSIPVKNQTYATEDFIWQQEHLLPNFGQTSSFDDRKYPVCGVWIVNHEACGLGIREEGCPITTDASRFVPHIILN